MELVSVAVPSSTRAMPKSITRGPSGPSSTLPGLKSRCTIPALWMATSAVAVFTARRCSDAPRRGPLLATAACSDGPSTYSLTTNGGSTSRQASWMAAVQNEATFWAARTSFSKRARSSSFSAHWSLRTLMATSSPSRSRPR